MVPALRTSNTPNKQLTRQYTLGDNSAHIASERVGVSSRRREFVTSLLAVKVWYDSGANVSQGNQTSKSRKTKAQGVDCLATLAGVCGHVSVVSAGRFQGMNDLHFRAVNGCGKRPLASKSCMSHSGAPSVFQVQKIHPAAFS
jgi:hypothetical protein